MRKALFGILMAATVGFGSAPAFAQDEDTARLERAQQRYDRIAQRNQERYGNAEQRQAAREQRAERQVVQQTERQAARTDRQPERTERATGAVRDRSVMQNWRRGQRQEDGSQRSYEEQVAAQSHRRGGRSEAEREEWRRNIEATREASRRSAEGLSERAQRQAARNQQRYEEKLREQRRDRRDDRRDWRQDRRDGRNWDHAWRNDRRYDWQGWRYSNRNTYRLGSYYAPYRGHRYNRLSIGIQIGRPFYSNRYWLSDPWQYRLPHAPYGTQWVRYYDDVLLVDVYSGEVIDVIYDYFW